MTQHFDIVIIGGGAAGFFTAINTAEKNRNLKIAILERGKEVLTKVRISGGGRCNVTHACFVPNELVKFYPRGEKELKGPFHQFCSGDTIEWFEKHGVSLKIEDDGRMFPTTNSSQTIIDCFLKTAKDLGISIFTGQSVQTLFKGDNYWKAETPHYTFQSKQLVVATGSNPKVWEMLAALGHTIVSPVPSLFTFNIKDNRLHQLMGVATMAHVAVKNTKLKAQGPLLITHWGVSGPGILRLSAWGARILFEKNYQFTLIVNWLPETNFNEVLEQLNAFKTELAKKQMTSFCPFEIPKRLWESLLNASDIAKTTKWADVSKKQGLLLAQQLTQGEFAVNGKSTFKEEFVTAGGIALKEVDFKTMESKLHKNLFLAGEILDIDAITGGFNFQNAWTGGYLAAQALSG